MTFVFSEEVNEDHDRNLIALLNKCRNEYLRLSEKKMQFKLPSVTFMGHKLNDQGVKPDPDKGNEIREMPRPGDKAGVQRFLGQYLSKFCKNLSKTVLPLFVKTRECICVCKTIDCFKHKSVLL